jgi:hypothetical protein
MVTELRPVRDLFKGTFEALEPAVQPACDKRGVTEGRNSTTATSGSFDLFAKIKP